MPRPSALSYQITAHHSSEFRHSCRFWLVAEGLAARMSGRAIEGAGGPKSSSARGALPPRKFCEKLVGPYPSPPKAQPLQEMSRHPLECGRCKLVSLVWTRLLKSLQHQASKVPDANRSQPPTGALAKRARVGGAGLGPAHLKALGNSSTVDYRLSG